MRRILRSAGLFVLLVGVLAACTSNRANNEKLRQQLKDGQLNFALKTIVRDGANVNARFEDGTTLLMDAVQQRTTRVTGFLIDQGIDPNAARADGKTALMLAAEGGNANAVRYLLRLKGVHIDLAVSADDGSTALSLAQAAGHAEIAEMLAAAIAKAHETEASD